MTSRAWRYAGLLGGVLLTAGGSAAATGPQPAGPWRVVHGEVAPWVEAGGGIADPWLQGAVLSFDDTQVSGPSPLGCANAVYEFVTSPAEGLFQGNLPDATTTAAGLGVSHLPVPTLRVICDSGSFDYHLIDADTLLTALDNVIWTLKYEPPEVSPVAVVQALLLDHLSHDMGFTVETVARKQEALTASLFMLISDYFARPQPEDEPPLINGDPFTDSQEYPVGFVLDGVQRGVDEAVVSVVFVDEGQRERPVDVVLRPEAGRWRIDDLRYEDGMTLRALLSTP